LTEFSALITEYKKEEGRISPVGKFFLLLLVAFCHPARTSHHTALNGMMETALSLYGIRQGKTEAIHSIVSILS